MNVVLNPSELLQTYELIVKNGGPHQEDILSKFRNPILNALEKEHEKQEEVLYHAWSEKEERRIQDLMRENNSIKPKMSVGRGRK